MFSCLASGDTASFSWRPRPSAGCGRSRRHRSRHQFSKWLEATRAYWIVIPPDWLKAFTCCTVKVPGPTQAPALFSVNVLEQGVALPFCAHWTVQETSIVWLPTPGAGTMKLKLCADSVLRIKSKLQLGLLLSHSSSCENSCVLIC